MAMILREDDSSTPTGNISNYIVAITITDNSGGVGKATKTVTVQSRR
jgi:hypothetical protein